MKKLYAVLAVAALSTTLMGPIAIAQDHHDDHADHHSYVEHKDWHRGRALRHEDWDRGERVDWHEHHLAAPPRGYEWRMIDGNYVLANSSNFQIRTVIRIP